MKFKIYLLIKGDQVVEVRGDSPFIFRVWMNVYWIDAMKRGIYKYKIKEDIIRKID